MNPIQALKSNARTFFYCPGGIVYRLGRVSTASLIQVGHAELVGQAEVRKVLEELRSAMMTGDADEMTDEERAKVDRNKIHEQKQAFDAFTSTIDKSPERRKAWDARIDAYCCAGIDGMAWLLPEQSADPFTEVDPSIVGDVTPCRFVRHKSEADEDNDVLHVGIIHEAHRLLIQAAVHRLNGVAALAGPFRRESVLSS